MSALPDAVPQAPNPGSDAAIALGCTCAVLDNNHGRFAPFPPGRLVDDHRLPGPRPRHLAKQKARRLTRRAVAARSGRPPPRIDRSPPMTAPPRPNLRLTLPEIMTPGEVARLLHLTLHTVRKHDRDLHPMFTPGRTRRYHRDHVAEIAERPAAERWSR